LGGGEVAGEVVVVDALPGFVGGAPGGVFLLGSWGWIWRGYGVMRWYEMR
jgi:hypothetical protein